MKSSRDIQVVILAGGLGTRLGGLTKEIPKPMVKVSGRPFLEWQFEFFKKQGFKKFLLLTGYLSEKIEAHFGDGAKLGINITYNREPSALGTGGALVYSYEFLEEKFLLMFGDSFLPIKGVAVMGGLEDSQADAVMTVYDNREVTDVRFNVALRVKNGQNWVEAYQKTGTRDAKPERGVSVPLTHVEAGVYGVRRSLVAGLKAQFLGSKPCSFEQDAIRPAIKAGRVLAFESAERFFDIGTPERLKFFEARVSDYF